METEKRKINSIAIIALVFSVLSILLYRWLGIVLPIVVIIVSLIGFYDIKKHNDRGKGLIAIALTISILAFTVTTVLKPYCLNHYDEVNPLIPQLLGIEDTIEMKKEKMAREEYEQETEKALTEIGMKKLEELDVNNFTDNFFEGLGSVASILSSIFGFFG